MNVSAARSTAPRGAGTPAAGDAVRRNTMFNVFAVLADASATSYPERAASRVSDAGVNE
jgi:hypothetical protein